HVLRFSLADHRRIPAPVTEMRSNGPAAAQGAFYRTLRTERERSMRAAGALKKFRRRDHLVGVRLVVSRGVSNGPEAVLEGVPEALVRVVPDCVVSGRRCQRARLLPPSKQSDGEPSAPTAGRRGDR